MIDLLESYSLSSIVVFIIILCLAIKEAVTFYDWAKTRLQQGFNKELAEKKDNEDIHKELQKLEETFSEKEKSFDLKKREISEGFYMINEQIDGLNEKINILIKSDKDDIKAYITEKHHYFCYQQQWIDDYSMDCLEKRYEHYQEEKGNSFVENLMEELRALPKQPLQN